MSTTPQLESKLSLSEREQALFAQLHPDRIPQHVAIIMDGNGRWAKRQGMPRIKGHKAAIGAVQETLEASVDLGVGFLTVYAFSTENWKRPAAEIGTLMALLRQYLRLEKRTIVKHRIRVRVLGSLAELAPGIQRDLNKIVQESADHEGLTFNIALNYSGRSDILHAVHEAARRGLPMDQLNEETLSRLLSTGGQPDPDLVIRTSGEMRVSNFLLWQIAYAEIVVTPTLWPDFRRAHLYEAILEYQRRDRRFGGI